MALLPPIPDRPADRPETWTEYLSRRAIVAMHRQLLDEIAAWAVEAPPFTVDDVLKGFGRFAAGYEFKRTEAAAVAEFLAVRLLADPTATDLFFTDGGVLQATNLDIDLAPELKELIPPAEAKWIDQEIERLGPDVKTICEAADQTGLD